MIELEPKSNSIGNWLLGGNTWPYKPAFDAMDLGMQYQDDGKGNTVLVRLVTNVDFGKAELAKKQFMQIVACVEESPIVLRLQHSEHKPDLFLAVLNAASSLPFVRMEK